MSTRKLEMLQEFDKHFRSWVAAACEKWKYPMPSDKYYTKVYERIPEGLRTLLSFGVTDGLIIPKEGYRFTLKGLPTAKGPYSWFSQNRAPKEPAPNWEYFVQVAEFIRIHATATERGLSGSFEDDTMDIALYQGGRLYVYCEVKEKTSQIQELIKGIKAYQSNVDLAASDRGNDPLRKAKCIVKRRPEYFVGVAIGARFEYRVIYPDDRSFQFVRDVVPLV
ncbi:MAG: hypothetical protein A2144_10545 [Chloroflexi bacterium RBG_16_50_9]|nr:MAG: hypothetical protein A2144_10545 [Chloroflexi bacterium RBG_16_50_9]